MNKAAQVDDQRDNSDTAQTEVDRLWAKIDEMITTHGHETELLFGKLNSAHRENQALRRELAQQMNREFEDVTDEIFPTDDPDPDTCRLDWLEENLTRIQEMPVKVDDERRYGFWCQGRLLYENLPLRDVIDLARDHETPPRSRTVEKDGWQQLATAKQQASDQHHD